MSSSGIGELLKSGTRAARLLKLEFGHAPIPLDPPDSGTNATTLSSRSVSFW